MVTSVNAAHVNTRSRERQLARINAAHVNTRSRERQLARPHRRRSVAASGSSPARTPLSKE